MAKESSVTDASSLLTRNILDAAAKTAVFTSSADVDDRVALESKNKKESAGKLKPAATLQQKRDYFKGKKVPKSTSNASEYASTDAMAVVGGVDIGRIIDLGLGRGVDATSPTPWLSKSSFQVRPVTIENIIGTEEGGALQSYEREISSIFSQQVSLKASITVPQSPFTIGVDAEHSRSVTLNRRSVGKKIINRVVSFRADFEDAPRSGTTSAELARQQSIAFSTTDSGKAVTFEERFCRWILDRIRSREELKQIGKDTSYAAIDVDNPVDTLADIIRTCPHEDRKLIVKDCTDFVCYFRITHYVSAIELGAAEYQVMSEQEYYSRIGAGGSFGVQSVANAAVSSKTSWRKSNRSSNLKRIGIIKPDGTVKRGSYGEAVVGIQVQPISNLVKMRYLQLALQKALSDYVEGQGRSSVGPFFISCNNDQIFLTVNPDNEYAVEGTTDLNQASEFYIIPREDTSHPYEFQIAYHGDVSGRFRLRKVSTLTSTYDHALGSIPRFLNASISTLGTNSGPLRMEQQMSSIDGRLSLKSRVTTKQKHIETTPWVTGRDIFYIRCSRRRYKMTGYIALKLTTRQQDQALYTTSIVSSVSYHNYQRSVFMLFRLLPAKIRELQKAVKGTDNKPALPDFEELHEVHKSKDQGHAAVDSQP